jgi:glycosyltransferase involved in cell wall biosynthesis
MNKKSAQELVSILMPAKDVESFVSACIQSIINQSYLKWELIVVDDHSSDNTYKIIDDYALKDNRIKIVKNFGNGIIDALKLAYENSKGHFITRMDADDLMSEIKIEELVNLLQSQNEVKIATGYVEYFSDSELGEGYQKYAQWLNQLVDNQNHFAEIYKECVVPSPCWMMRRKDFESIGAFNNDIYPEDYDLCFRMYAYQLKILGIPKVLHYWRDYNNRTSRTSLHYADNSFIQLKMHYFIKLDYNKSKKLILLGAGKKGKQIAKILVNRSIPFTWVTNNPKKIGLKIYDVLLEDQNYNLFSENHQVIIAIANPNEQKDVANRIENSQVFWFC